jgi:hypothetical protein
VQAAYDDLEGRDVLRVGRSELWDVLRVGRFKSWTFRDGTF